jgi:hypothetical protein
MAVVDSRELFRGRGGSQKYGEVPSYKREFLVRVDTMDTSETAIAQAPGIAMLDAHPDVAEALLNDVSVTQDGDSPFHYRVSLSYGVLEDADENPLDRPDQFNYTGAITSGPCFIHYDDGNDSPKTIVNTAGDPLPGLEKELAEWRIAITGNRADFDKGLAADYLNTVNSDSYSGLAAGTVKCQGISGSRKIELVNGSKLVYWEVNVELAHRGESWRLKTWDCGFNEIVGGERKKILDAAKKELSEPVSLHLGAQKTPVGSEPDLLEFKVYKEKVFTGTFPALP